MIAERFDTVVSVMTETEARECEQQIVAHFQGARDELIRFYEGRGWQVIGHTSFWGWAEEIGGRIRGVNPHYLYNYIKASFAVRELSTIVESSGIPESHLRPLTRFVSLPDTRSENQEVTIDREAIRETWDRAHEIAEQQGEKFVARHVEVAIQERGVPSIEDDTLDPPMELEQVVDQFPDELTAIDRELLAEDELSLDSNEWYTPVEFIEAARAVMGSIDTDPASNDTAQAFIQAGEYYTKETNGLIQRWGRNVWLNPPYAEPLPWVEKLLSEFEAGNVKQAILLVNTANSPQWSRLLWHSNFAVCLLDRRIRFWRPDRADAKGTAQDQMIWYIGYETDKFREVFESFGAIR